MDDNEVGNVIRPAGLNQLTHHIVATVESLGVGKHKTQLLPEGQNNNLNLV